MKYLVIKADVLRRRDITSNEKILLSYFRLLDKLPMIDQNFQCLFLGMTVDIYKNTKEGLIRKGFIKRINRRVLVECEKWPTENAVIESGVI